MVVSNYYTEGNKTLGNLNTNGKTKQLEYLLKNGMIMQILEFVNETIENFKNEIDYVLINLYSYFYI